jgi:hypothetical protein
MHRPVKHFDNLTDVEQKKIIQAIIPRIVIHLEKTDQIKNWINADPESKVPLISLTDEGHKFLFTHNWLGKLDEFRTRCRGLTA